MYVLDSDTLIYFLKGNADVIEKFIKTPANHLHTTIINASELLYGAYNSVRPKKNVTIVEDLLRELTILPLDMSAANYYGREKTRLKKLGNLIADMDLMIASVCLAQQMTLVSNNIKHFSRINKLKLDNWCSH